MADIYGVIRSRVDELRQYAALEGTSGILTHDHAMSVRKKVSPLFKVELLDHDIETHFAAKVKDPRERDELAFFVSQQLQQVQVSSRYIQDWVSEAVVYQNDKRLVDHRWNELTNEPWTYDHGFSTNAKMGKSTPLWYMYHHHEGVVRIPLTRCFEIEIPAKVMDDIAGEAMIKMFKRMSKRYGLFNTTPPSWITLWLKSDMLRVNPNMEFFRMGANIKSRERQVFFDLLDELRDMFTGWHYPATPELAKILNATIGRGHSGSNMIHDMGRPPYVVNEFGRENAGRHYHTASSLQYADYSHEGVMELLPNYLRHPQAGGIRRYSFQGGNSFEAVPNIENHFLEITTGCMNYVHHKDNGTRRPDRENILRATSYLRYYFTSDAFEDALADVMSARINSALATSKLIDRRAEKRPEGYKLQLIAVGG
jgi:hypothetical protein